MRCSTNSPWQHKLTSGCLPRKLKHSDRSEDLISVNKSSEFGRSFQGIILLLGYFISSLGTLSRDPSWATVCLAINIIVKQ